MMVLLKSASDKRPARSAADFAGAPAFCADDGARAGSFLAESPRRACRRAEELLGVSRTVTRERLGVPAAGAARESLSGLLWEGGDWLN